MRLYVLTLNFWDSEEKHTMNTTEVYSTYELAKKALKKLQAAIEEYQDIGKILVVEKQQTA